MELAAQVIGILAMTVNILVVQFKKPQHIFLCRATVRQREWVFELRYTIRTHSWCLLRKVY